MTPPDAGGAIHSSATIHHTADVEADVEIGPETSIWHRAQIRSGASIGGQCVIGGSVFVDAGVRIGNRVKIQNGSLVYHGVTVEDGVFIGPGAILTNDRHPRAIAPGGELASAADWTVSPIRLRRGSSIGAGAVVVAGNDVGEFAMVGAGAVVTRSVASHALVVGNPARRIGWVCACGARLTDRDGGQLGCPECGRGFALVPGEERITETSTMPPNEAS